MKTANKANPFSAGIPPTYAGLVNVLAPRAIHDPVDFENASEIMYALAGHNLNAEQEDYLETISILVDEYDRAHNEQPEKSSPLEVLRYLVEENDISTRELSRILGRDESLGSKILSGERAITAEHARKLAGRFGVNAGLFV